MFKMYLCINENKINYLEESDFLAKLFLVKHHPGFQHILHDVLHFPGHEESALCGIHVEEGLPGEAEGLKVAEPTFDASLEQYRTARCGLLKDARAQLHLVRSEIKQTNLLQPSRFFKILDFLKC